MSEPETTSENNRFSTSEPEVVPRPAAERHDSPGAPEPIPEWDKALNIWQWAWELHWVGLGCLFTCLALYALWSTISMTRVKQKRRRTLSIFISSMLFLFGVSRALFLFINPYESTQCYILPECPVIVTRVLFGIGLPCLTASFSFIQLVFLQVIKMRIYPGRVQSWKFLLMIIVVHFSLALFTEVIVFMFADWRSFSIVCQVFFIVFSLVLSVTFIYTGRKIIKHVMASAKSVSRMGQRSDTGRRHQESKRFNPNVSKLVKITYITAVLGFVSCALQFYSIFHVYNMYREKSKKPDPWPWWIFQTLYRLVEFVAGCTMAYVCPRQTRELLISVPLWLSWLKRSTKPAVFYTNTESGTSDGGFNGSVEKFDKRNDRQKQQFESKSSQMELVKNLDGIHVALSMPRRLPSNRNGVVHSSF